MIKIPKCSLIDMPIIGFGTWQIPSKDAAKLVSSALKIGYNHIDCAEIYNNEEAIGEVFEKIKDRDDVYVTSKLWCTDHDPQNVPKAIDKTLKNLKLDHLDMYLIHNPLRLDENYKPLWYKKEWILETWREMIKLRESGKTKRIGVSNFTTKILQWLIDEGETPSNNQVELHPFLPQTKLVNFCRENKIALSAYSPLGNLSIATFIPSLDFSQEEILLKNPIITEIAAKNSATPAQVLLKWEIDRGIPVLVKSSSETRMKENLESINLKLSEDDIAKINSIEKRTRYLKFDMFMDDNHSPQELFGDEFLG